jgi:hypothetical protein
MSHKCREIDFKFMEGSEESSKNGEFNAGTTATLSWLMLRSRARHVAVQRVATSCFPFGKVAFLWPKRSKSLGYCSALYL